MTLPKVKRVERRWAGLTEKQAQYVEFVVQWRKLNRFGPTLTELAKAFKVSDSTAQTIVNRIIHKGFLKKGAQQRSLQSTPKYRSTYHR